MEPKTRISYQRQELLPTPLMPRAALHFDYEPTDEAIFKERQREKALMKLGWSFVRLEWRDLFMPGITHRRILDAMDRAARINAA